MSETKMRMTNEWLGRVQQFRADVDARRHPLRPCPRRADAAARVGRSLGGNVPTLLHRRNYH